jgi:predicted Zn-dependent peptidase
VDKPDINQTYFRIGSLGIKRRNPDYVEIQVLNTIFGGRFTSWLNTALRINAGLTYSARSFFAAYRKRGPFVIASYTATESTDQAISMSLQQLQRFRQEGVQEEELGSVKKYIRGQFPPTMETSDQLAALIADLEFHEQDASFVDTYLDKVQALSAEAAHRLIERYFPADGLIFTCIGEAERIEAQVAKFGPITRRSITTPGF